MKVGCAAYLQPTFANLQPTFASQTANLRQRSPTFANVRQPSANTEPLRQLIGLDTLGPALLAGDRPDQGKLALDRGELAADRGGFPADRGGFSPDRGGLELDRGGLTDPELQQVIAALGNRPRKEKLRQAIGQLCAGQWRSVAWLAALLRFEHRNLSDRHLTPMLKDGLPQGSWGMRGPAEHHRWRPHVKNRNNPRDAGVTLTPCATLMSWEKSRSHRTLQNE